MKKLTVTQHAHIQTAFYVLGGILALASCGFRKEDYTIPFTLWIALALVVAGVVWRVIFIKCPHCGDGLYGSRIIPKHCPNCGKSLSINPTEESDHE